MNEGGMKKGVRSALGARSRGGSKGIKEEGVPVLSGNGENGWEHPW